VVSEQKVAGECLNLESNTESDVWRLYLYAMKSPVTRDKYQRRLSRFFEYAGVHGESLHAKALSFTGKATTDPAWPFNIILGFLEVQNERVNKREITGATVRNVRFSPLIVRVFPVMVNIALDRMSFELLPALLGVRKPMFDYERMLYKVLLEPGYLNSTPSLHPDDSPSLNVCDTYQGHVNRNTKV
jgi:hypothetical protein